MEQIEYISEVDYDGRVQDFNAVRPRDLFARGMRDMHACIAATKERMAAEFSEVDLYMCMDVYDLDEWLHLFPLAPSQSLLSTGTIRVLRLQRNLRKIFEYYSTEHRSIDDWALVVAIAMRHRRRLLSERPERSPEHGLDHRISWALSLSEIAQAHPWAEVVVRAYLAWIDGTGSVERGLGTHTAVLASHAGPRSHTSKDAIEMATEVRLDGPAHSTCISYESASGALVAGRFVKDCAALWLRIRGRRFGSYKKRKDAGVAKIEDKLGTFKNQRLMQKRALDSQSKQVGPWLRGGVQWFCKPY
jgi:hypothetical protein